jgi:hypothetical protein
MTVGRKPSLKFKKCSGCGLKWKDRSHFLSDPDLVLVGYQVHFEDLELGLFLFNHMKCGSTIAIEAKNFTDLYDGPIFKIRKTGKKGCPGHCLHADELRPCPAKCECAFVRDVISIIKDWDKATA